jgi:metal-responsive CopG/Arc/MetJ family transcriptional regulator
MAQSSKKLNFFIDGNLCREFETLVPAGKRSKVINNALRKELESIRREKAVKDLLSSSPANKRYSNREIIDGLTRDRGSH